MNSYEDWENDIVVYDSLQNEMKNHEEPEKPVEGWCISFNDVIVGVFENQEEANDVFNKIDKELNKVTLIKETSFSMQKPNIRVFKTNGKIYPYITNPSVKTDEFDKLRLVSCRLIFN